jgi:hypothetical protein
MQSYRQCCATIRHATNPPNVSKKYSKLARTANTGSDRKLIICNHLASSMLCDYRFVISPAPMSTRVKRRARRRRRRGLSHSTDMRDFCKVEKWTKDGSKVDRMLWAGSSLEKAREIFEIAIKHRPRIRLTIRQRTRVLQHWPTEVRGLV